MRRGRHPRGFSMIEILITLLILSVALAAAGALFNNIISGFRQQSKITESGIESNIGLHMLKKDIETAGYGLPWSMGMASAAGEADPNRDGLNGSPTDPPRAFSLWNSDNAVSSDHLAIRSVTVAGNETCRKWTLLATGGAVRGWGTDPRENLAPTEHIIVVRPGPADGDSRTLAGAGNAFAPEFQNRGPLAPPTNMTTYVAYGLDASGTRMPFNRADYYLSYDNVPTTCAPGTGVLVKAVVSQDDGTFTELPLLDCVADMQVVFELAGGARADTLGTNNAEWIRNNVAQVFVSILAHEGRFDRAYAHDQDNVYVGNEAAGLGRPVVFRGAGADPRFDPNTVRNYRWRVYNLVVRPNALR